jgi:DUF1680 family protein
VKNFISVGVAFVVLAFANPLAFANANSSPFAQVQAIDLHEARWTSGFWFDKFELCRTQMVPSMERLMSGTNYTQFIRNFEIAAGLAEGRPRGAQFNDGDFYKWFEAASAMLAYTNDAALEQRLDEIISVIAKAQRADGYIHTPVLIRARNGDTNAIPFKDRNNWELYNMGHLLTAASVHYHATGKTNLLTVARKAADFLYDTFLNAPPEMAQGSVCPSHYVGLIDLYRVTREPRYLELVKIFFALRNQIKEGTDDNQDRIPFDRQREAMGHAARANYLYAGATDLFLETGDTNLWKSLTPIWTNVVQEKMYITGGCGALYDGASPDGVRDQGRIARVHQSYGRDYQLPNTTAHNETCANVANAMWNWRMFLATGEARFMNVVELEFYNAALSGVGMDGTNFFYTNPLRVTDPLPTELRWSRTRVPFVGSFCCPPNLVRTIAESANYAYAKSDDAIWINLYGGSALETKLANGATIKLAQETEYPWSGRVRIRINECGTNEFELKLRIPGWTKRASVRINNKPPNILTSGAYAELRRVWKSGDFVDLDLPMTTELIEANPLVEEALNQIAIKRGPVVYCVESADLLKGVHPTEVFIPANMELRARYDSRLLGGVVVIEGDPLRRRAGDWNGKLYREVLSSASEPIHLRMIPYFAWANRGASEMTVWLPRAIQ